MVCGLLAVEKEAPAPLDGQWRGDGVERVVVAGALEIRGPTVRRRRRRGWRMEVCMQ